MTLWRHLSFMPHTELTTSCVTYIHIHVYNVSKNFLKIYIVTRVLSMATSLTRATSVPNCNCKQAWAKFLITSTDLLRKTTKVINEITLYHLYHLRLEGARDVNFNRTNLINFILYLPTNNESLIWFKLVNVLMETTIFNSHWETFVISRWYPLHKRCCFLKK